MSLSLSGRSVLERWVWGNGVSGVGQGLMAASHSNHDASNMQEPKKSPTHKLVTAIYLSQDRGGFNNLYLGDSNSTPNVRTPWRHHIPTTLQHPRCSCFKLSIGDVRHRRGRSQRGRRLGFFDGIGPFSVFFVGVYIGLRRVPDRFFLSLFILSLVSLNPV